MEQFLKGRTALVTGSSQGIGLAIGKAFAAVGARIGVHGLADETTAAAAVAAVRHAGAAEARFFDADMREPDSIDRMMDDVENWGGCDILVNNAGIQHTLPLAEATRDVWDAILAVNLTGAFHTMRRALPR
jgi:3-hydroxybutyrate dehydrogenase